jgi:hypothetical protein
LNIPTGIDVAWNAEKTAFYGNFGNAQMAGMRRAITRSKASATSREMAHGVLYVVADA